MQRFSIIFSALLTITCGNENPVPLKDGASFSVSLDNYTMDGSMMVEKFITLPPSSTVTLNIVNIPSLASFVLAQTHTYEFNTSLSYSQASTPHGYINGTNIGLVQMTGPPVIQFFIHNENRDALTMLIMVHAYGRYAPIPGGCNMEFSVEIAPYLCLKRTSSLVEVDAQLASLPNIVLSCDDYSGLIRLQVYRMYLPERDFSTETYFDAIRKMATVAGIQQNGKMISAAERGSPLRRIFSAYPGTGSVYAVIAVAASSYSAYVPSMTYACGDKNVPVEDMCQVLVTPFSKLLCAAAFFSGILVCFAGHKFFKTEMFFLGFLIAAHIAYIIFAIFMEKINEIGLDVFSFFSGLGFGLLLLGFWVFCGIPILSVILITLSLGYVTASVIMFAGLGDVSLLQWDVNFWVAFFCIMIVVSVTTSTLMHKANIIGCAVLGALAVIIPIDHYVGSNLKYILVNTLRRATVPDFSTAIIDPPFQWTDIVLAVTWVLLSIIGSVIQFRWQRGKPPFPPPPYVQQDENSTTSRRRALTVAAGEVASDRTPLLADVRVTYGVSPNSVFSSPASANGTGPSSSSLTRLLNAFRSNRDQTSVEK